MPAYENFEFVGDVSGWIVRYVGRHQGQLFNFIGSLTFEQVDPDNVMRFRFVRVGGANHELMVPAEVFTQYLEPQARALIALEFENLGNVEFIGLKPGWAIREVRRGSSPWNTYKRLGELTFIRAKDNNEMEFHLEVGSKIKVFLDVPPDAFTEHIYPRVLAQLALDD